MGLASVGGGSSKKGSIITTSFIHTQGWDVAKWYLEVDPMHFSSPERYNTYNFSTTALKNFTLKFEKVADYFEQYSVIYPLDSPSNKWKVVQNGTYAFEKGKTYVFSYGFATSGSGYGVAVGKLI